jgi:hypothetical protein
VTNNRLPGMNNKGTATGSTGGLLNGAAALLSRNSANIRLHAQIS